MDLVCLNREKTLSLFPQNYQLGFRYLEGLNLLILGGDIYRKSGDDFEHTYDNWYYDANVHSESIMVARQYLDNLREQDLYVSFVFKLNQNNKKFYKILKSSLVN